MNEPPVRARDVQALADEVKSRLPEAARALAQDTLSAVLDGLRGTRTPAEILGSDGGKVAVGAGAVLLATGFVVGRSGISARRVALTVAVAAGGFAAGYYASTHIGCRPDAVPALPSEE